MAVHQPLVGGEASVTVDKVLGRLETCHGPRSGLNLELEAKTKALRFQPPREPDLAR